jgi:hypothetical protein
VLYPFLLQFKGCYQIATATREKISDRYMVHALWIYRTHMLEHHFHIGETAKAQI